MLVLAEPVRSAIYQIKKGEKMLEFLHLGIKAVIAFIVSAAVCITIVELFGL